MQNHSHNFKHSVRAVLLTALITTLPASVRAPQNALEETARIVAIERIASAEAIGEHQWAETLRAEVQKPLSANPVEPTPANISTLRPPQAASDNPYIGLMVSGAKTYLAKADTPDSWPKLRPGETGFMTLRGSSDDKDVRNTAARMDTLLWLFANPASPLRHDPAVLATFLRRAHAYTDALEMGAATLKPGKDLLDDFAIAPAACALREFATLYPGLLYPSQKASWDRAMRLAADAMMLKAKDFNGRYANIDLALSFELLNFGLYLDDPALLAKSRELFIAQEKNILPDGATHYIWSQNESPGYHDTVALFIARIYEITGDEAALDMLRRMEWFGPVSVGRRGEYWTAPSWKHTWNGGETGTGGEPVAFVSRNPFLRGMITPPESKPPYKGWEGLRGQVAWWAPEIPSQPLPDRFTILDRNTAGPRAWYGPFNYAATLRPIPTDEPGHSTLIGAQVLGPGNERGELLMGVYPRVFLGGDRANPRSFAWITSGLQSGLAMGREWSAFAADYQLHGFGSSKKGNLVPWRGRQIWLGLPDRIVGVLELEPIGPDTPSASLETLVRLGTGGTVFAPPEELVPLGDNRFRFGDLIVVVHASDFEDLTTEVTPFRVPKAPFHDLVFMDSAPTTTPRRCVVEIRLADAAGDAVVSFENDRMVVSVGEKSFSVERRAPADPNGPPEVHVSVESPDPVDSAPAWKDFATFVSQPPASP